MSVRAWCLRLKEQLPGWHFWYSSGSGSGWYAVPAPADMAHAETLELPNRLGPYQAPGVLREACRERYGWDEFCGNCGVVARDCGHRGPETRARA